MSNRTNKKSTTRNSRIALLTIFIVIGALIASKIIHYTRDNRKGFMAFKNNELISVQKCWSEHQIAKCVIDGVITQVDYFYTED